MSKSLSEILGEIRKPLPDETMTEGRYFKNDVYEWWVRKHADHLFRSEIIDLKVTETHVSCIVRIHIGDVFHDGMGFKVLDQYNNLTTCVDLAREEAKRSAFDMFGLGWHNIGKYRQNRISEGEHIIEICAKCHKPLTEDDLRYLEQKPTLKIKYHEDCIPQHLKK